MAELDQFLHRSSRDPVTGLPDGQLLQDRIEQVLRRSQRSATNATLIFISLDQLEAINHAHAHGVGDAVLCAVARRLETLARPGDTLARLEDDQFVVLREDLQGGADAQLLAGRIREAFVEPFRLDGWDLELTVPASVRVSLVGPTPEEVIDLRTPPPALVPLISIERGVPMDGPTDVDRARSVEPPVSAHVLAPEMSVAALHALAEVRTTTCEGIYFTRHDLQGARVLKRIEVTLSGRGSSLEEVKVQMADQARAVGAQAVVNFRYGHGGTTWWRRQLEHSRSSGWHGEGEAVRW